MKTVHYFKLKKNKKKQKEKILKQPFYLVAKCVFRVDHIFKNIIIYYTQSIEWDLRIDRDGLMGYIDSFGYKLLAVCYRKLLVFM